MYYSNDLFLFYISSCLTYYCLSLIIIFLWCWNQIFKSNYRASSPLSSGVHECQKVVLHKCRIPLHLCFFSLTFRSIPFGIASLIAKAIVQIDDIGFMFRQLGMFVLTVTTGIVLLHLVFLPLVLFITTRRNPFKYILSIYRAWLIAFASTSTYVYNIMIISYAHKKPLSMELLGNNHFSSQMQMSSSPRNALRIGIYTAQNN